jgi:GH25 family lysozyme M1 (1,4-beta-N-acetylmuramidase)
MNGSTALFFGFYPLKGMFTKMRKRMKMKRKMKVKKRMVSVSIVLFFIAMASCVIALSIDTPKIASAAPKATVSSSSEPTVTSSSSAPSAGMQSNGPASMRLIDVSHYDVITDWNALKSNIDGIYIKATEGVTFTDPQFNAYAKAAIAAKIPVGFYHYFWPGGNAANDKQQADYFYNAIKGYKFELYPVLDIEETNKQTAATISDDVKAFCDEFKRLSNQQIIIYCSPTFADTYLGDKRFTNFPLWIAHYNVTVPKNTVTWHNYVAWQYNSKITRAGVSGPVDGDVATTNVFINESSIDE